jgi:hypothetical protein
MRLQALEVRIDADLRLGRHAEVITELRQMTATHSLRERLHGLLMLALHRDGRQAEALAVYQHARRILVDEIGTEPGAELCGLHYQILTSDPALTVPGPGSPTVGRAMPVPQELPARVPHFIGRATELAALTTGLVDGSGVQAPDEIVISVIGGTPGVGKPRWRCTGRTRSPDGSRTGNCT